MTTSLHTTDTRTEPASGAPGGGAQRGGEGAGPEHTGAGTPEAAELISGCREQIDVLDARILLLIRERMAVSAQIQRTRLGSGGRRVQLAREMEILRRYEQELGRPGTQLAMLLLQVCRGSV